MVELSRILRKDIHPVILNSAGEELLRQIFLKGKCHSAFVQYNV